MAERQGFEPWVRKRTTVFETAPFDHSGTSPHDQVAEAGGLQGGRRLAESPVACKAAGRRGKALEHPQLLSFPALTRTPKRLYFAPHFAGRTDLAGRPDFGMIRIHRDPEAGTGLLKDFEAAMFAVIRTGGKQYKVAKDDIITVEKLLGEPGDTVEVGDVLMIGEDGKAPTVGTPLVDKAAVFAEVVEQTKSDKVIVFKKQRRQGYRRTRGHRQNVTVLKVLDVSPSGAKPKAAAKKAAPKKADAPAKDAAEAKKPAAKKPAAKKPAAKKPAAKKEAAPKETKAKAAPKKEAAAKKPAAKKPAAKKKAPAKKADKE